jgi:hypothetical protein
VPHKTDLSLEAETADFGASASLAASDNEAVGGSDEGKSN